MPHPKRFALTAVFVISLLPFSLPAWGQGGGGGGGAGGGGSAGGSSGGQGGVRTRAEGDRQPTTPRTESAPIFISGRVVTEDGNPPPERAAIERVCNGKVHREGYTDSRGYFSIELGKNLAVLPDATIGYFDTLGSAPSRAADTPNPVAGINLIGCEIRVALPGFHSDSVPLAGRRPLDSPDIGTLVLHPFGEVEGTVVSAASLRAPKSAKKALHKGLDYAKKSKWEAAQKELLQAVQIYPGYGDAWFELGVVYRRQGQTEEARTAFQKALATDSRFIRPYFELAQMAAAANKWQEAAHFTDKALALNPYDYPMAYFINSVAYYNLRNLDRAEKSALQAQHLDSQHRLPQIDLLMSDILIQRLDYQGAAERLRSFLKVAPDAPQAELARTRLHKIEQVLVTTSTSASPEPPK
jgi:tetratricopeptide (TPR) repeat protein